MLFPDLIDRFTTHLKEALQKALSFTVSNGRMQVEPGDLLVGLLHEKGSIGAEILLKSKVILAKAENAFRGTPSKAAPVATPDLSLAVKRIIEKCVLTAHLFEHKYVGTEHLLFALIEGAYPEIDNFLAAMGLDMAALKTQLDQVLKTTSRFPELLAAEEQDEPEGRLGEMPKPPAQRMSNRPTALESFARELTKPEIADALDPVIGRERELARVIEILCRRTKNNPVLLGEPGVGKTAIVEGLAKKLAEGDVPDVLRGKRLLSLDLALTVAGTMYRGEFEARLKQIIDEAKSDPNVILFIDEVHNIVGAGSTTGSLDAANILKPALARGEIRCVGATTWAEFKKHIEPDAALERRLQPISVEEPTAQETLSILRGIEPFYAKFHKVIYASETLPTAVRLAERYLTERRFPDKAIDLLDEAAARVNARRKSGERMERLASLEVALRAAEEQKEEAVTQGKLEDAEKAAANIERLSQERTKLSQAYEKSRAKDAPLVTAEDVAAVVAHITGSELSEILQSERDELKAFENRLKQHIVGQTAAVRAVAEIVNRSRLGLNDPARPKAALLFVGPSGTGKTEMARRLAQELFRRDDALIKIDMTEFSEGHSVSKLVGAPAGYVGYREANKLTDNIRKRPHSVLLFDEFEKAHPDVQNILLQMLEDGTLSDATGRPISLRHAYIVLTTNFGQDRLTAKSVGFGENEGDFASLTIAAVRERLRPELLNRLDRIVVFNPLGPEGMRAILERELQEVLNRVTAAQHVAVSVGDDVLEWLLARPLPPEEGARAVRRLVEREITTLITSQLSRQPQKKKIRIKTAGGNLKTL